MALTTLYPKEAQWGVNANEPVYDGHMRVGYWDQTDSVHPTANLLGQSTAVVEFDLRDLPRGLIVDSAILFIHHISDIGAPSDVGVYGANRRSGNPSDFLGSSLASLYQLSGPFANEDIILDVTDFIQTSYNEMGLYSFAPLDFDWLGADFILGSSAQTLGYRNYVSGFQNVGGSRPSLWITTHFFPRSVGMRYS